MKLILFLTVFSISLIHFFASYSAESAAKNLDISTYKNQALQQDTKKLIRQMNLNFALMQDKKEFQYLVPTEYEFRQIGKTVNYLHRNIRRNTEQIASDLSKPIKSE